MRQENAEDKNRKAYKAYKEYLDLLDKEDLIAELANLNNSKTLIINSMGKSRMIDSLSKLLFQNDDIYIEVLRMVLEKSPNSLNQQTYEDIKKCILSNDSRGEFSLDY